PSISDMRWQESGAAHHARDGERCALIRTSGFAQVSPAGRGDRVVARLTPDVLRDRIAVHGPDRERLEDEHVERPGDDVALALGLGHARRHSMVANMLAIYLCAVKSAGGSGTSERIGGGFCGDAAR